MKLRHIVLFLLVTGIALLTVAMPVSAQLNKVDQNGTVLLGEEGLNVTAAVGIGTPYLAWWDSTSSFDNPPDRIIDLTGYSLTNFNIDDDPSSRFVGTEGKGFWWRLYSPGQTNPTEAAFQVVRPQAILSIRNLDISNADVTNGKALLKHVLDFQFSQSNLHYIFLRDNTSAFDCQIVVKSPNGVTYSSLWTPYSTTIQFPLVGLPVNSTPWYWSSYSGNGSIHSLGWNTGGIDPITSLPAYSQGTYQVWIECNQNNLGFIGQTRTITLEEEKPVIKVTYENKTGVPPGTRSTKFYTEISNGIPNTWYLIWIKDCVACPNGCCNDPMNGVCCEQPPMIVDNGQWWLLFYDRFGPFGAQCDQDEGCPCDQYSNPPCIGIGCPPCQCGQGEYNHDGVYYLYDTLIKWCGCLCTKTLYDIIPHEPYNGKYYYALVYLDSSGNRTIEWQTSICTKPTTYQVHTQRWEYPDVCEIDLTRPYADACVNIKMGDVTINTDVCDEITDISYLGETVHIYGVNKESPTTYLFFTGPCQSCYGVNMNATKTVIHNNASTFTAVPVKPDGTWEYYWYTRNLQIDLGTVTIYASSMPNDIPSLIKVPCNDCAQVNVSCANYANKSFTFLEPTLTGEIYPPKPIQIICCSDPSIVVKGEAMGLRGEAIGQEYDTIRLGLWVFGENKVAGQKYIFQPIEVECSTGKYSVDLRNYISTLDLLPGTYTVIVQHPMYNHRLDIIPESWICKQSEICPWLRWDPYILMDEVWYPDTNRKFVVTATPIRWSKLFVIDGPDRLAGTAALNALLAGFDDRNIDDKIKVLTFKVESNNALQAGFSGTPTSGGAPLSVQFTDISIGNPTTWAWDFGDGYTSTEQNPLHVYENTGTYPVTLTVTGLSGSSSITKNNYVTVTTGPTPTGTVTTTPTTPPPASTIVLNTGWNFVSTPRALADGSNTAGVVFAGVNTGGRSIYYYNAETVSWQALTASTVVKPLDGIWIYSTTSTTVPLTYKNDPLATPPTKQLFAGWNSIGFTDVNPAAARDTLQSVQSQWTMTLGFNSASQVYDNSIIKGGSGSHSDTTPMNPFKGYWLFMNAPGTLAAISA